MNILEAETRTTVRRIQASGKVTYTAFSPDGHYLVTGLHTQPADPQQIGFEIWDVLTGEKVDKFYVPETFQRKIRPGDIMNDVYRLRFSPDGRYLAVRDGYAEIWDIQRGVPVTADGGYIWTDNKRYVKTTHDTFPVIVDIESGKEESKYKILKNPWANTEVSVDPNGKQAAFLVEGDTRVEVWDLQEEKILYTLSLDDGEKVKSITYSPDGKRLVTGEDNGNRLRLWNAATGELIKIISHPDSTVKQLAFRNDGKRLATATLELIALFDIE